MLENGAGSLFLSFRLWIPKTVQRSALCTSRRELSNEYLLANFDFDTAENEPSYFVSSSSRKFEFEPLNFEPLICSPDQFSDFFYQKAGTRYVAARMGTMTYCFAGYQLLQDHWQIFANFWRARSRLYQNEILQENMRLTAFFKLYKIGILLHRCNLKIFAKKSV